jgi:hypothetical protein
MDYLIVVGVALLVGAITYVSTLRNGRNAEMAFGFGDEGDPEPDAPRVVEPGYTYLKVATTGPSWRDRIQGFVGLVVLIAATAAVLALGIYQLGHLVNQLIQRFLEQ